MSIRGIYSSTTKFKVLLKSSNKIGPTISIRFLRDSIVCYQTDKDNTVHLLITILSSEILYYNFDMVDNKEVDGIILTVNIAEISDKMPNKLSSLLFEYADNKFFIGTVENRTSINDTEFEFIKANCQLLSNINIIEESTYAFEHPSEDDYYCSFKITALALSSLKNVKNASYHVYPYEGGISIDQVKSSDPERESKVRIGRTFTAAYISPNEIKKIVISGDGMSMISEALKVLSPTSIVKFYYQKDKFDSFRIDFNIPADGICSIWVQRPKC